MERERVEILPRMTRDLGKLVIVDKEPSGIATNIKARQVIMKKGYICGKHKIQKKSNAYLRRAHVNPEKKKQLPGVQRGYFSYATSH
jgi:hypothetical protein